MVYGLYNNVLMVKGEGKEKLLKERKFYSPKFLRKASLVFVIGKIEYYRLGDEYAVSYNRNKKDK